MSSGGVRSAPSCLLRRLEVAEFIATAWLRAAHLCDCLPKLHEAQHSIWTDAIAENGSHEQQGEADVKVGNHRGHQEKTEREHRDHEAYAAHDCHAGQ